MNLKLFLVALACSIFAMASAVTAQREERIFSEYLNYLTEQEGYYREELMTFQYWLSAERFDRHAVNRRLKQYALGDEEWQWA